MKEDLSALILSSADICSASGMEDVVEALCNYTMSSYRQNGVRLKLFFSLAALGLAWCGLYHLLYIGKQLPFAFLWLGMAAVLFGASWIDIRGRYVLTNYGRDTFRRYLEFNRSPTFKRLYDEAEKFNQLLRAIELADELAELNVDTAVIEKRSHVLQSLARTRANLIRALKLDKIRREFANLPEGAAQNLGIDMSGAGDAERNREIGTRRVGLRQDDERGD